MTLPRTRDVRVPGISRPVRVTGAREVLDVLEAVLPGWPSTPGDAGSDVPLTRLDERAGSFRQHSATLSEDLVHDTPVSAACSVVVDLIEGFLAEHPDLLGIHCGSAVIDGRLLLFPETHRAGKSTLTAALAAVGQRVAGDDVLALTPRGEGMALGIAPRLRLPLPASLDPALRDYIEARGGPDDGRYRYLDLPDGQLAAHGECFPLGAVVLLERDVELAEPELIPLAPGEGLAHLLRQHFAHDLPSETLMARFLPVMRSLPCRLLRYGEPLAAARLLVEATGDSRAEEPLASAFARPPGSIRSPEPDGPTVSLEDHWQATPAVREYELDEDRFLIHVPSGAIHRLNPSGQLVWALLRAETISGREIADLLSELHPDAPARQVEADVRALLADLVEADLVIPE